MKNFPRMYILSNKTLNKGKAVAQSCHGLAAFQAKHPNEFDEWDNYYIVCLRADLESVYERFVMKALEESKKDKPDMFAIPKAAEYREPDMGDTLTAMAFCALNEKQLTLCEELFNNLPLV